MRLFVDIAALEKARKKMADTPGQLGLFAVNTKPVQVRAHLRHTDTGAVAVAPHLRHVRPGEQTSMFSVRPDAFFRGGVPSTLKTAEPEPEPTVELQPTAEPSPDLPPDVVELEPMPSPEAVVPPEPTPAEALARAAEEAHEKAEAYARKADELVATHRAVTGETAPPDPAPEPTPEPDPPAAPPDDQPPKLAVYAYEVTDPKKPPAWLPENVRDRGDGVFESPVPLNSMDARLLGLRPHDRPWDPYEIGHWESDDGTERYTSGASEREIFGILDARWSEFQAKFEALEKKAKRLKLDPPTMETLAKTTRRSAVELPVWGSDERRVVYEELPATLVRIRNPDVKVKGWTVEAVIRPVPGTDRTFIAKVGKADDMPDRMRHTGMHCDQCGTDRDRSFVVAMRNEHSHAWQQVGGSCLKDFTGRSAQNLASSTEFLRTITDGLDDYESDMMAGRDDGRRSVDDVLMLAVAVADQDGGFISKARAEDAGVPSTATGVQKLMASPVRAAAIRNNPAFRERAEAIREWMRTLEGTSEYEGNLRTYGEASAVLPRHLGLVVSAVGAYERAQAEIAARASRGTPKHFGKAGDKIGRKLSKKDRDAGATAHPTHRVKVVSRYAYDTQYGPQTIIVARDNAGHTFKWKASGVPERANPTKDASGMHSSRENVITPGETFDLVATVKGHSDYKGVPQTEITRAEFHRVLTPREQQLHATAVAQYKAAALVKPDARQRVHDAFMAALPDLEKEVMEGRQDYQRWRVPQLAWERWRERADPQLLVDADWAEPGTTGPPEEREIVRAKLDARPEHLDAAAEAHANEVVRGRAALTIHEPLEEEMAKAVPQQRMTMRPDALQGKPPAGAQPTGEVPPTPGQRVKFRHPSTGDMEDGHIHGTPGHRGATVVDGHGQTHKVPHGHYVHHDADADASDPKPSAELLKQAARKHLELGPDKPLAVHAAAMLLSIGGVRSVHKLQSQDVRIEGDTAKIETDKKKTDDPQIVGILKALQQRSPRGPLFVAASEPITEQSLTLYAKRFGRQMGGGAMPLAKAAASALDLPTVDDDPIREWALGTYKVRFAKGTAGIGICMIESPDMPLPLVEVCGNLSNAIKFAGEAVSALRQGRAPSRGVYQAVRT